MSIEYTVDDNIALITINRPEVHNALDGPHYQTLSEIWTRVRDDTNVRVAIVTGAGEKAFCAGADLRSYLNEPPSLADMMISQRCQILNRGLEVWKPVIAAVNGFCLGGGTTLMFATDIRIASDTAVFGLPEVKRGLPPGNGGTQRVLEQLPYAIGMEMLLTGGTIDAEKAARWGLVNRVVPQDQLMNAAYEMARKIAKNPPLAVQGAKELAVRSADVDMATGLRMEELKIRLLWTSQDVKEGVQAFAERREPNFKGE